MTTTPPIPKWWGDTETILTREIDGFLPRPQQAALVAHMWAALSKRTHGAVEAKVGSGKSFAALVVADHLPDRVVITTATRALQSQLRVKDVPVLVAAGVLRHDAVVLEGRGRYGCAHRARVAAKDLNPQNKKQMQAVAALIEEHPSGLRDELPVPVPDWLWERACSDPDACKALECTPVTCAYMAARGRAREAHTVIVNHHVLLADANIKGHSAVAWGRRSPTPDEPAKPAVLGPYRYLVVDEAHALEAAAESFGERRVTIRGIQALATRMKRLTGGTAASSHLTDCLLEVQDVIAALPQGALIEPMGGNPILTTAAQFAKNAARSARDAGADSFDQQVLGEELGEQCANLAGKLQAIDEALRTGKDELGPRAPSAGEGSLVSQLVDAGPWLRTNLWDQCSAVLMSGTMRVPARPAYVAERVGLHGTPVVDLPSVFDYSTQRLVYVTPRADRGGGARCDAADVEELAGLLDASDGRALVLFPSLQDLRFMYEELVGRVPHLMLGQSVTPADEQPHARAPRRGRGKSISTASQFAAMPNHQLADLFHTDRHSILLATRSFFEGVDFPGDSCSLVVVARFPNLRPDDPLVLARRLLIERSGGNPWVEYQEPSMGMLFAQACGRAIRRLDDKGVVAVLDPRAGSKQYAKRALLGLKPSDYTDSLSDVRDFLVAAPAAPAAAAVTALF